MRKWGMLVALALVLMPVAAVAQQPAPGMGYGYGYGMMMGRGYAAMRNPAEFVLNHQRDLNLTPDQLKKIGQIRDHYMHENAEALSKVDEERAEIIRKYGEGPYTEDQRESIQKDFQERHKDFAQLMDNRRKAMDEIRETLSPSQQSAMRQIMRNEMGRMRADRDRDDLNR